MGNTGPDSPDWAVQVVLAAMMATPHRPAMSLIQQTFPGRELAFYADVLRSIKALIEETAGGLDKATRELDPSPTVLDRLSFVWRFLRLGDVLVGKLKRADIPLTGQKEYAAIVLRNILPMPLQEPLLASLLSGLRLGPDARYLLHYCLFKKAKIPSKLLPPFGNIVKTGNLDLLRIVVWWCIRARREEYIEVRPNEPVRIEFAFVVEQVLQDLKGWCGTEIEKLPGVTGEIESELNSWLTYSRLQLPLDDSAPDIAPETEIAKAFVKHNVLTTKLRILRADGGHKSDERVRQLEAAIRQYADENRTLEERLRSLEASRQGITAPPVDLGSDMGQFAELREVLKTIDTKYAFDALNAVQLGEETHLTLRSFVLHLFYALRKSGFSEYPKEEHFILNYDSSGLYDCDGFEVPPSGSTRVKVARKGWALNVRGRWLPIRRARVVAAEPEQK